MRIIAYIVFFMAFFLLNTSSLDSLAKEVTLGDINVKYDGYHYEMIYVTDDGELIIDIETDGEIRLFLVEEDEMDTIYDYLRDGKGQIKSIYMNNINGKEKIDIKKSGSGNVIILILNHYTTEIVEKSGDAVTLNMNLKTKEKEERWDIDLTIFLFILVPILGFLIVVYWIRRKS